MKRIKGTINYKVPSWNFCNSDHLDLLGTLTTQKCKFCVKKTGIAHCLLYDKDLVEERAVKGPALINKCEACCKASAGYKFEIVEADVQPTPKAIPTPEPKAISKLTIDAYEKAVSELMSGKNSLPYAIAAKLARDYVLKN